MTETRDDELPAILGGEPLRPQGPPPWPQAWEEVSSALKRSMEEGTWGKYHGPNVRLLEEKVAAYHQVEFVELCCSGTFAVELALRALRLGPGDEVILAGYDFIGNFNDIVAVGARPVLIDVDPNNCNLNPELLGGAMSPNTRAVLVSHLHGGVVPMKPVMDFARGHGIKVIEDACQMPGARIDGRTAGTNGDVGVISFGGGKLLSAGRGGALLTSSAEIRQQARVYCNRGNHAYPLSELQATVLLPQLERLDDRNQQRAAAVAKLVSILSGSAGLRPLMNSIASDMPGYYKLGFQYDSQSFGGLSREKFVSAAMAEGVEFNVGFRAFHLCRSSRRFRSGSDLSSAAAADANLLVLHHPVLLEDMESINQVVRCIRRLRRWAEDIEALSPDDQKRALLMNQ
jgi:perosamine synthetase